MATIKQYDIVRVVRIRDGRVRGRKPWFDRQPLVGDVGTVLEVYEDPPGFEVEGFVDGSHRPLWVECFEPGELELIDYDRRPTSGSS